MRYLTILLMVLLVPQLVLGATITGVVYDLDLEVVTSAVVSINTQPEQRAVTKDGTYTLTVPPGSYLLTAEAAIEQEKWSAEEELTVSADGDYTLDIILLPDLEINGDIDFEEGELPEVLPERDYTIYLVLVVALVAIIIGVLMLLGRRKAPMEDDEYRAAVLKIIKKHKGRITQKALRKEVPFSEAKVSLVISELESEGKIKKIKKGRGNIISLQK